MDKPYFGTNLLHTRLILPSLAGCVGLPTKGLPSAPGFFYKKTRQKERKEREDR